MKIRENIIYEIWKEKKFVKNLITHDSQNIEIIDPGTQSKDSAGPDFFNARIKFGNITYLGDVEIDSMQSDWKSHGHYFDKKYNKVILHLIISHKLNQPYVYTKEGRKVHSICMLDFLDQSFKTVLLTAVDSEKLNRKYEMPCLGRNDSIHKNEKLHFLFDLGVDRFKKKTKRLLERLKEMIYLKEMNIREPILKYDFGEDFHNKKYSPENFSEIILWEQLIYEMIFEALGYSKNKDMMLKLARAVNINFINNFRTDEKLAQIIDSSLFSVSGLLPNKTKYEEEDTSEYLRKITETWNSVRNLYDGTTFKKESWNFFKLRPQNFPTIRIAGGALLISQFLNGNMFKNMIEMFDSDHNDKETVVQLRNLVITEGQGYWVSHFNFDKPTKEKLNYFIGISRADEIIVNVLLPVLSIYFEIFDSTDSARRVKSFYINYTQKTTNQLVEQVSETLGLGKASRKSINYQAMIELFRNYCVKERCLECKIGEKIFN
ncbi:MAG: DUF2851 family protein [Ignavibacteriales bacterium]